MAAPPDPDQPRTVQLAAAILQHTTSIESYLQQNGLPSPSFAPGAPPKLPLPPNVEQQLAAALGALDELNALLLGPMGWLLNQVGHAYDLCSLHALYRYKIPAQLAVGEEVSVAEIARRCDADEDAMARLVQHAVTNYLLVRPRPGHVAHSATSAMLANVPVLHDFVGNVCEDMWPSAHKVVPALAHTAWRGAAADGATAAKSGRPPNQTAHNLAEGTDVPFFETLKGDPERARRFASAMSMLQTMPGFEPTAALEAYDWGALGHGATVVDVGGSAGTFAVALTDKHPDLHVIVQDLPDVIDKARAELPARSADRVALQSHDFFTPQPVTSADAYFFRMILHDWSDDYCLRILRQLIPALKPGARVVINDLSIPPPGATTLYEERQIRCKDIAMMAMFNSKERTMDEWTGLVAEADPRFRLRSVVQLPASPIGLIEFTWEPAPAVAAAAE
ncbi:S-adenosyl-L-methionine-dependent methyltransferase [Lasiosphaeria miniovina]|uniref:S-adenosyl-L-methionine-dependent methyltransferase n=1 Tax=Lasiosphaeria miniovina TaxID=1954250 RepID=A0AA40DJA8_9PEZI|nr:S-adenosyl-L-methionine-dependent methyltransferase [Lasiosphaeria miniovina]KAK0702003.1 S-adenosyl-L-methionine-dependent methyltransferase [Lasiosphaeria miniovina]